MEAGRRLLADHNHSHQSGTASPQRASAPTPWQWGHWAVPCAPLLRPGNRVGVLCGVPGPPHSQRLARWIEHLSVQPGARGRWLAVGAAPVLRGNLLCRPHSAPSLWLLSCAVEGPESQPALHVSPQASGATCPAPEDTRVHTRGHPTCPSPTQSSSAQTLPPGVPSGAHTCTPGTESYTFCTRMQSHPSNAHPEHRPHTCTQTRVTPTYAHSPHARPCTPHSQSSHLQPSGTQGRRGHRLTHGIALTTSGVSSRGRASSSSSGVSRVHPQGRQVRGRQQAA